MVTITLFILISITFQLPQPYMGSLSLANEALVVLSLNMKNMTLLLCQIKDGCVLQSLLFLGDSIRNGLEQRRGISLHDCKQMVYKTTTS